MKRRWQNSGALPLTAVVLIIAFGAVIAAVLPLIIGALAIAVTLGIVGVLSHWWAPSVLIVNVVTMIGLGLGIDYALLTVSRFRDAIACGRTPAAAAAEVSRQAGAVVVLSDLAVAIGFAALSVVPVADLRSVAIGGLLVATVSVLLATTLLPAMLAMIGRRIDVGRILSSRNVELAEGSEFLRSWGRRVAARPWPVLIIAIAPVILLAVQAARLDVGLPRGDWLPPTAESARALTALETMGHANILNTVRIIATLPEDKRFDDASGWSTIKRLDSRLSTLPGVLRVSSLASLPGTEGLGPAVIDLIPDDIRRAFVSRDRRMALLEVIPVGDVRAATDLARKLRQTDTATLADFPNINLTIGGLPALNAEYEQTVGEHLPVVVGLVVATTLVLLAVGFRSVLIPIKAIALNLLAVAAAFGAVVLVFQDGFGVQLLGLSGPIDSVFPIVPVLVFCTVFGLSMNSLVSG